MNKFINDENLKASNDYWKKKADLFSRIYVSRNISSVFTRFFLNHRSSKIEKHVKTNLGATVLDAGCGSGEFSDYLSRFSKHVLSVDYSKIMLQLAKHKCKNNNIFFLMSDCSALPTKNHSVDHLYALGLLDYVEDVEAVMGEFYRVLKNSGSAIITIPKSPSFFAFLRWFPKLRAFFFKIPPIINTYNQEQLAELIAKSGFKRNEVTSLWTTMWIIRLEK